MIQAIPNSNFHRLKGPSVHEQSDPAYQTYRRKWHEYPRQFIIEDFPIHLDIEATNRCNLKCVYCDKLEYLSPDQMGDMDFDMFKRIVDEGSDYGLCSIKLSYRGEPLLHPQLPQMVAYAKGKDILDVYFNTNGMLLSEDRCAQLIDAGLDRISVSMDGYDSIAFEKYRRGASFDRIVKNIDRLRDLRGRKSVAHPKIRIQTVNLPEIDLEEYARFWESRCDEVATIDYKEGDETDRRTDLVEQDWACPQLWQRMTIEWDGTIMPCNNDDYRKLSAGNVRYKPIRKCWRDLVAEKAREYHRAGESHLVDACNGCPWRTAQILKMKGGE